MKLLPYFLYFVLLAFHQVILSDALSINHVSINLAALMVSILAMYKSEMTSLWFGFVLGLVLTAGHPNMIGLQSGLLAGIGLGSYHIRRQLNLDSLSAKLLLILGAVLIHNIVTVIFDNPAGLFGALWSPIFTGAICTTLLAAVFFLVMDRKSGSRRIKATV